MACMYTNDPADGWDDNAFDYMMAHEALICSREARPELTKALQILLDTMLSTQESHDENMRNLAKSVDMIRSRIAEEAHARDVEAYGEDNP